MTNRHQEYMKARLQNPDIKAMRNVKQKWRYHNVAGVKERQVEYNKKKREEV